MLGKLVKHEFKATYRLFCPLFLGLLFCSLVERFLLGINFENSITNVVFGIFTFLFALILFAVGVSGQILSVYRFYKSVFTDQGYLTNTLPAKSSTIVTAKLILGVIWTFVGYIVIILAAVIMFYKNVDNGNFLSNFVFGTGTTNALKDIWDMIIAVISNFPMSALLTILTVLVCAVFSILVFYVSFAIGSLVNKRRVTLSIVVCFALTNALSFVLMGVLYIIEDIDSRAYLSAEYFNIVMAVALITVSVLSVIFFAVTNLIMKHRLNLE